MKTSYEKFLRRSVSRFDWPILLAVQRLPTQTLTNTCHTYEAAESIYDNIRTDDGCCLCRPCQRLTFGRLSELNQSNSMISVS